MSRDMMTYVLYGMMAIPPLLLALAGWRNRGMHIGYWLGEGAALLFNAVGSLAKASGAPLRREATKGAGDIVEDGAAITAFTTPLLFAAAAALFAATEVALAVLGWAALHHEIPPLWMSGKTAVLAAVAAVTAAIYWGFLAVEARHDGGRIAGPWRDMPLVGRRRFELLCWVFAIGSLVTLAVFYGWRELQIESAASGDNEALRRWLGVAIIMVFGAMIGGAALFSGWALLKSIDIVGVSLMGLPGLALGAVEGGCRWVIAGIDSLYGLATAVYDFPASAGKAFWDWGCSFDGIGGRLHFAPMVFEERPRIQPKF